MSTSPQTLPAGTLLAAKFRVVRLLGAGGMGAVYEVEHEITKHRRALKVLHADVRQRAGAVERFLREASAAGRIGDPHIVETFDAGAFDTGEPYVVLELLSGETLASLLERERQLGLAALIEILAQACDGVTAAHQAGIVHRDLKPENLFLVRRGAGTPFVKILDFGISKFDAEITGAMALTNEGSALGTPLYMSPEQVRGQRDLDARADVYALGVILYECAAGEPPFLASSLPHLVVLIHEGRAVPLADRRPDLPAAFHDLVARAMAADRDQRTPSARALRDELRALTTLLDALADTAPEPAPIVAPALSVPPPAASVNPSIPPPHLRMEPQPAPTHRDEGVPPVATPTRRGTDARRRVALGVVAAGLAALVAAWALQQKPPPPQAVDRPVPADAPAVSPGPQVEPAPAPQVSATAASTTAPPRPSVAPARPSGPAPTSPRNVPQSRADQIGLPKNLTR